MTRIQLFEGPMRQLLAEVAGDAAKRGADRLSQKIGQEIRRAGRVNTGRMANSPSARPGQMTGETFVYVVGEDMPDYTRYQNDGTRGSVARPGSVLAFKPKGSSVTVFARSTRGVKPARFMEKAVASMTVQDFT